MDDLTAEEYIESSFKLKLITVRKAILYIDLNPQVLVKCIVESAQVLNSVKYTFSAVIFTVCAESRVSVISLSLSVHVVHV